MTDTLEMLNRTLNSYDQAIYDYANQIQSGVYQTREAVKDLSHVFGDAYVSELHDWLSEFDWYTLDSADYSGPDQWDDLLSDIETEMEDAGYLADEGVIYSVEDHEDPTVDGTGILDYGLELVTEVGRPWTWVLATGGPHIEVVADGTSSATLVGYWGGERVERSGDHIDTVLDYLLGERRFRALSWTLSG